MLRTKSEQKAYLDGYEMCAECIENYLSDKGKQKLECLLVAVRNAVEIEDIDPLESEDDKVTRSEQRFEKAVKMLKEEYTYAMANCSINKPIAYALYRVWRYFDKTEIGRIDTERKAESEYISQ